MAMNQISPLKDATIYFKEKKIMKMKMNRISAKWEHGIVKIFWKLATKYLKFSNSNNIASYVTKLLRLVICYKMSDHFSAEVVYLS